jgi:AcrR family transcriptional regulator
MSGEELGLRERKKQRQRQEIIEAAVELFRERGFEQTRVQDILDRAQISLGTFYNYFSGKSAVLDDFAAALLDGYAELARQELDARDLSVAERIRGLTRACAQAFTIDPDFMTAVVSQSQSFGVSGQLPTQNVRVYEYLRELFEEGQKDGEIRADIDPMQLAQIYSGNFIFTAIGWLVERAGGPVPGEGIPDDLQERLERVMDVFLDGCAPPSGDHV